MLNTSVNPSCLLNKELCDLFVREVSFEIIAPQAEQLKVFEIASAASANRNNVIDGIPLLF